MALLSNILARTARRAMAGTLGVIALSGCSVAPAPRAPDDGMTFVSLNPCLDAILIEIAEPEQILALSHYSHDAAASSIDPARARQFAVTGGTVEEVLALKPDVVLASTFIAPATKSALERMGIKVATFGSPVSVKESIAQVRALSVLTGREELGQSLVEEIEAAARAPAAAPAISTLMWQPGQIVPGETTLVGELLRRSGFVNHSAARGMGQGDYVALEVLLSDPPQLVLVAGDSEGQRHPMLARMQATHVETLDPGLLYCGGPTIIKLRERLDVVREAVERRNSQPLSSARQARAEALAKGAQQ